MRCLLQHRDCLCQSSSPPLSLSHIHMHPHRVNVVFFIFCMKHLVPVWYPTIFQNAIIVCRSGHPIARTLICVCVFWCGYYEGQTVHMETYSLVELKDLIIQQCCTLSEDWLYSDHRHTSTCWGDNEDELNCIQHFVCWKQLSMFVCFNMNITCNVM